MTKIGLAISRVHFPVSALGPGQRLGVWFQGCSAHCPGCVSPETWEHTPATLELQSFLQATDHWLRQCTGVTITGGEPLEQPEGLLALLKNIKEHYHKNVLLFTGQTFAAASPWLEKASPLVDAVVCGPYQKNTTQTLALRGSDNQTLHCLTPLGHKLFSDYKRPLRQTDKKLDVMLDTDGHVWFAGIPQSGDLLRLGQLLGGMPPPKENVQ